MMSMQNDPSSNPSTQILRLAAPFLIALVAFVVFLGFQTSLLLKEQALIKTARGNQDAPIAEANKVRQQLDRIAGKTAALSAKGNPSAKLVIDDLSRQGITIGPH